MFAACYLMLNTEKVPLKRKERELAARRREDIPREFPGVHLIQIA